MDASVHKLLDLDFDGIDRRKMDSFKFFEQLLREYHAEANSSKATMEERFRNLDRKLFSVDVNDPKWSNKLFFAVQAIMDAPDDIQITAHRMEDLCKILTKNIGKNTEANKKLQLHMEASDFHPKEINDWFRRVREEMARVYQAVLTCREYGLEAENRKEHKGKEKLPKKEMSSAPKKANMELNVHGTTPNAQHVVVSTTRTKTATSTTRMAHIQMSTQQPIHGRKAPKERLGRPRAKMCFHSQRHWAGKRGHVQSHPNPKAT